MSDISALQDLARMQFDRSRLIPVGTRFRLVPGGRVYTVVDQVTYSEVVVSYLDGRTETNMSTRVLRNGYAVR